MEHNYGFKKTKTRLDERTHREIEKKELDRIEKWTKMLPELKKSVPRDNDSCIPIKNSPLISCFLKCWVVGSSLSWASPFISNLGSIQNSKEKNQKRNSGVHEELCLACSLWSQPNGPVPGYWLQDPREQRLKTGRRSPNPEGLRPNIPRKHSFQDWRRVLSLFSE